MTIHTVLAKKEYTDEGGEAQRRFYKVGFLKETDQGGRYLTLFIFPETTFVLVPDNDPVIQLDD